MRLAWVALCAMGCGWNVSSGSPDARAADDATVVGDDAMIDAAAFDPTEGVEWFTWPEQQTLGQTAWGTDLIDVARHLPASYGSQYWDANPVTASHETSHGIHAHLRNYEAPSAIGWNAFYVLDNRAAFVKEPAMRKSDIKSRLPAVLRGSRYQLYLVEQTAWDDSPLYVFDEWNSYVNGAEVAVQQVQSGLWTGAWQDAVMGPLEFTAYAIATAKAVAEIDPAYFASNLQFKRFTAWNIQRAMALYSLGSVMTQFEWNTQEEYATKLRTHADVEALRQFARDTWTPAWTQSVLGF
jgi:hypothetical protein